MPSLHPLRRCAVELRLLQPAKRWTIGHLDLLNVHAEDCVPLRMMIPPSYLPLDKDDDAGEFKPRAFFANLKQPSVCKPLLAMTLLPKLRAFVD